MNPASLNAVRRSAELAQVAGGERVDLAVVGGGVTGAGIALDAAARGLSVVLLEANDLAFGTSRWSSKLVHGGLRYLAKGDFALAHESAVERGIMMTVTAPHLTRTLPQLFPLHTTTSRAQQSVISAGLQAGDVLRRATRTPGRVLPRPRTITRHEALALAPGLRRNGLRGALLSFDGALTDDARLVVALARTAASHGARILTRVRATKLLADRVQARDELTGQTLEVQARQVINATGVWAGELVESVRLRPSRGSHLILRGAAAGTSVSSVMIGVPGETNRFVFLLPQPDGNVYLGLTDEPVSGPIPSVPTVPESDVDFLLEVASSALARRLTHADVVGRFAGLRPLIAMPGGGRSADLSRKHAVLRSPDGVLTVVGGKLTTYRRMAADAVDAAGLHSGPSTTHKLPLVGAAPRSRLSTVDAPRRLVVKYGTEAPRIAAIGELDPALAEPVFAGSEISGAEVVWAIRNEGALDVDDVLERRTRLGLVPADASAARERVADLVDRSLRGLPSPT
ncbi:glycerol-3-phosphate dehydrogenase/oxidase [Amycolatopsis magusensis]|uniref:Glycerol-3-phosphate dehydrogenase n=1 Tax=Amycolatopsis magusensis TaxID=882444 RepID=A0ABS4PHS9_9PSEU|nr:glycerol-3-phosphate dehydrogenase/oxidase [Amycolatopsis magusensis]MBP2178977.1 glycerol-3-phosphate dehydrogenase [Amycolatopsis magusensis]